MKINKFIEFLSEITSDDFRGTLPRLIAIELASRYRPIVQVPVKI